MKTPYTIPKPCEGGHGFTWSSKETIDIQPRKVIAKVWNTEAREERDCVCTFHQWGMESEEVMNGVLNNTVAIVELEDGRIVTVLPHDVKFIKEQGGNNEDS